MTTQSYFPNTYAYHIPSPAKQKALVQTAPFQRLPKTYALNAPQKAEAHQFLNALFDFLFPNDERPLHLTARQYETLTEQFKRLLGSLSVNVSSVSKAFFAALPTIGEKIFEDAEATLAFDPAAISLAEVIFTYPGFYTTAVYRLAHELYRLRVPLLPRMLTECAHSKTGIDIHPAAQIGRKLVIDHGTGLVIGATAVIGNHVTLYHGVTLGALQVKKSLAGTKRHPTIEDHVTIYANATILGGQTTVGHHSVLGGNIWLTYSVPPHSRVFYEGEVNIKHPSANK
jgi:serine O-acetyltransferase